MNKYDILFLEDYTETPIFNIYKSFLKKMGLKVKHMILSTEMDNLPDAVILVIDLGGLGFLGLGNDFTMFKFYVRKLKKLSRRYKITFCLTRKSIFDYVDDDLKEEMEKIGIIFTENFLEDLMSIIKNKAKRLLEYSDREWERRVESVKIKNRRIVIEAELLKYWGSEAELYDVGEFVIPFAKFFDIKCENEILKYFEERDNNEKSKIR